MPLASIFSCAVSTVAFAAIRLRRCPPVIMITIFVFKFEFEFVSVSLSLQHCQRHAFRRCAGLFACTPFRFRSCFHRLPVACSLRVAACCCRIGRCIHAARSCPSSCLNAGRRVFRETRVISCRPTRPTCRQLRRTTRANLTRLRLSSLNTSHRHDRAGRLRGCDLRNYIVAVLPAARARITL